MSKKVKQNNMKRILKYFKDIKGYLLILFILMVIITVINILEPIMSANLLTNLTEFNVELAICFLMIIFGIKAINIVVNRFINIVYAQKKKYHFICIRNISRN